MRRTSKEHKSALHKKAQKRHYAKLKADPSRLAARQKKDAARYAAVKANPETAAALKTRARDAKRLRMVDPAYRQQINAYMVEWARVCRNNPDPTAQLLRIARRMLRGAKLRAKEKNLPFDLVLADIKIPTHCPIFGTPLHLGPGKRSSSTPSFDRIVPDLGYVRGNVAVVSDRANRLKSNANADELIRIAIWIKHNAGANG